jgi:hypothetical protein
MNIYNLLVNVGNSNNGKGAVQHEVPKYKVTAAEIVLMRHIHGGDATSRVRICGQIEMKQETLRARLKMQYSEKAVDECFGKFGALPTEVEESERESDLETPAFVPEPISVEGSEADEESTPAVRRGRPPKAVAAAA